MYAQITPDYTKQRILMNSQKDLRATPEHKQRVLLELRNAGLSRYALGSMEAHYLPRLIHTDEHIEGAVFGYQEVGFVMIVATNWRVIFLDRKPLFTNADEVHYGVVSGVNNNHAAFGTTVWLHTRVKEYKLFTLNRTSAKQFVNCIELRCMQYDHIKENIL